jgi:multidrug efflux pump subunit AcrA (membrane-fusion protein)
MKATFANTDNVLWPGLSVSTRLLVDTLKQVTVVPEDAVQRGPNGLYAFVIGDGNKAEIRGIKSDDGSEQFWWLTPFISFLSLMAFDVRSCPFHVRCFLTRQLAQ